MAADITATGNGSSAAATSHAVTLGAGTADKAIYIGFLTNPGTVTPPTDWTIRQSGSQGSGGTQQFGYVMTRAGTSDTSVSVTTANSVLSAHVWRVFSGSDIANAVIPAAGVSTDASPNPPASGTLTSGDYLIDAVAIWGRGRNHSAYPANYTDDQQLNQVNPNSRAAAASRTLTAITSEDPGVYTISNTSEWVAFTLAIPEPGGLNAPGSPSATADSTSQITVDWTDTNTAETGYRVEQSPAGEASWVDVSGNLAADTETYVDTGLDPGTSYDYRIFAFDGGGDGPVSSTVSARTTSEQIGTLPLAAVIGQYDARDLPGSDTDPVASWADVGPKAQDPLAQATGSKQPVLEDSDSRRWVLFDGSDDLLVNSLDQTYTGDFAIIAVLEPLTYPTGNASVLYSTGFINGTTNKNILGIDDVEAGFPTGAWVTMSGDGTQGEHWHGTDLTLNTEATSTRFVMTQLVRNAGLLRLWENDGLVIDQDPASAGNLNDMPGMFLGCREDETRHMHARVGVLVLVDMSQATEAQLLSARDTLMSEYGVTADTPVTELIATTALYDD